MVILCYRSGDSLVPYVESVRQMLSRCNFTWELVLVGNYIAGSDDQTPRIVAQLAQQWPNVRSVIRPKEGMMGWDMRMGLDAARGTYVGVIDGDGQFPPESIIACLLKADSEGLDLTKTYRVVRDDGLYRRFISVIYNLLFQMLFGLKVRDINSKPKIIRREKYKLMNIQCDDWFVDAEIIIRAGELGLTIGETPVHFSANNARASFVRPSAIFQFMLNLFKYRFRRGNAGVLDQLPANGAQGNSST